MHFTNVHLRRAIPLVSEINLARTCYIYVRPFIHRLYFISLFRIRFLGERCVTSQKTDAKETTISFTHVKIK